MSKKREPILKSIVFILIAMASMVIGIKLQNAGVSRICCAMPIVIAMLFVAVMDDFERFRRRRREIARKALLENKISEEEFIIYLVAMDRNDISDEDISIVQSALESDDPELLVKAREILGNPKLKESAKDCLNDSEVREALRKIFKEDSP